MPAGLTSITGEFQINDIIANDQDDAQVAFIPGQQGLDGFFGVIYESTIGADGLNDLFFRSVALDGTLLSGDSPLVGFFGRKFVPECIALAVG